MANRLALIIEKTGIVENIALDERPAEEIKIPGYIIVDAEKFAAAIGDHWDGATLTKPAQVVETPQTVTPKQARLALFNAGLLEQVEAAVAAGDKATQVTWEYAIEFKRDDPLIAAIGGSLGLTNEQIDQLFVTAASL